MRGFLENRIASRIGTATGARFDPRLCVLTRPPRNGCYGRRMLHHVVTFDLKPEAPADQVEQIAAALDALAATLPEVRSLAVGADLGLREGNAGFAVAATFDDVGAFRVYADHPEHLRVVKELIGPHITGRHPVQFTA
jgi:hypothetical protein